MLTAPLPAVSPAATSVRRLVAEGIGTAMLVVVGPGAAMIVAALGGSAVRTWTRP